MNKEDIIGSWKMISWFNTETDSKKLVYPMGKTVKGYHFWNEQGFFSFIMSKASREKRASADTFAGSLEERAQCTDEFFSYAGHYEFDGKTLKHHGEIAMVPNWEGATQTRYVKDLGENRIEITTAPFVSQGAEVIATIVFEKITPIKQ